MNPTGVIIIIVAFAALFCIFPANYYQMMKEYTGNDADKVKLVYFLTARHTVLSSAEKISTEYGLTLEDARLVLRFQTYAVVESIGAGLLILFMGFGLTAR